MSDPDFNELLQAAEQLSAEVEGTTELPKVERTLRQVLEASNELWSRVAQSGTGTEDVQAHLLLGSKGVDLPQLSQKLETISSRKTFEPLEPVPDVDIKSFLKNEQENALLAVIEEVHRKTFEEVEQQQINRMLDDWKKDKSRILNSLLGTSEDLFNVDVLREKSVNADAESRTIRSSLDHQEMAYAKQITEYNKLVIQGVVRPSLVDKFFEVAESLNDKKTVELWEVVRYMTQIPVQMSDNPLAARNTSEVQAALILQARKYLQDRYKVFMSNAVSGSMLQARRGGVPGTYPLVLGFVRVHVPSSVLGLEDGLVDGLPVWPVVFYCLRCGDVEAALFAARQAGPALEEFSTILEQFQKSRDFRLSSQLETLVRIQYRRQTRNITDPFKRAVYSVISACDVHDKHSEVAKAAEDYLWFKLCQIREDSVEQQSESSLGDKITYSQLQTLIIEEYGESYFSAQSQPHLYFQMLFLTGQFEAAIEFLARTTKLKVHAVHVAIALHELGLLAVPNTPQSALLIVQPSDVPPSKRLNFSRLIVVYVRKFEATDFREALHYYYFLRNVKNENEGNLFATCICDLVLETHEFDTLLGCTKPDGFRVPGLVDMFFETESDTRALIELVASDAEKKALFEVAVKLYDLAGNTEKMLTLLVSLMSQVVSQAQKPDSLRARLQEHAKNVSDRTRSSDLHCRPELTVTFSIMKELFMFFDYYHSQHFDLAMEVIQSSKLIPTSESEVPECSDNFKRLSDEVTRVIPDVLLATMNILCSQYSKLRGSGSEMQGRKFEDVSKDKQLLLLRQRARAITSFAGHIPYCMPGETISKLVQMEAVLH
ncbi:nuclear pore complex protein Nup93-like isoform X2 [Bacillus rossius redtenbacheri]|uniref:nuclear pore complex protein Nup93-like isoform X2 n=1 Tax=Bacillus rossius redtenbacheri TaxID=93214 RepID=UPI002FDE28FE